MLLSTLSHGVRPGEVAATWLVDPAEQGPAQPLAQELFCLIKSEHCIDTCTMVTCRQRILDADVAALQQHMQNLAADHNHSLQHNRQEQATMAARLASIENQFAHASPVSDVRSSSHFVPIWVYT